MNNRFLITLAIHKLCPDAEYTYENDDLNTIQWIKGTNPPTSDQIKKMLSIVEAELKQKTEAIASEKDALLNRLGITADEAALLLG
jgi:hypothetical protein